jgi:hypothetical protein
LDDYEKKVTFFYKVVQQLPVWEMIPIPST